MVLHEPSDLGSPEEYSADHPKEHASDWGWHGEWGRVGRGGAWSAAIVLVLLTTTTHYNGSGGAWLLLFAAAIVVYQIWDIHRRRNAWRR